MTEAVRAKLGDDRERAIHLRGDREVSYGEVIAVVDQLAAGGFLKVALLANARGGDSVRAPSIPSGGTRAGD